MKKLICLFVLLIISQKAYAIGINTAAVNTIRYRQAYACNQQLRYRAAQTPHIYSEQQARYYGMRVYPNQYQYQQNYANNYRRY